MYIQMVQGACTQQDDLRMLVDDWCGQMTGRPGWLGGTYGFTDDDQFVGMVRFETGDHARQWCAEDDAGLWWATATTLLDDRPKIHESGDVTLMLDGGSDDAGFVQVIRGRVRDAAALRSMLSDQAMTSMMHEARPEIIGATLVIEDDGTFTETISFTDEESARQGEQLEMPAEMAQGLEDVMQDASFLDLHHPWFGHK